MSQSSRIHNRSARYNVAIEFSPVAERFVESKRPRSSQPKAVQATIRRPNIAGAMRKELDKFNGLTTEQRKAVMAA